MKIPKCPKIILRTIICLILVLALPVLVNAYGGGKERKVVRTNIIPLGTYMHVGGSGIGGLSSTGSSLIFAYYHKTEKGFQVSDLSLGYDKVYFIPDNNSYIDHITYEGYSGWERPEDEYYVHVKESFLIKN